jgi:GDP-4-dehydro-6-deoxy-D-mannose reductase
LEKYLITGFSGFVSKHFIEFLDSLKIPCAVLGIDLYEPVFDFNRFLYIGCTFSKVDLLEKEQIENAVSGFRPDYILHLASYSSVAFSWKNPVASFSNNTNIYLNLMEQVRKLNAKCRILSVGSSEEYGNVSADEMPLSESHSLRPVSPYAVARVSQEMLSKIYVDSFSMDIIMTRSFNHVGPGQKDIFVISSFAKQLVEIKTHDIKRELRTGDTTIIRDFLDVRDVVKAYYQLFKKGEKGEIYNVCSGKGITLDKVISFMADILGMKIDVTINPELIRPNDNQIIIGNNEKIKLRTGWQPCIKLEQSLTDIINYWKARI